MDPRPSRPSRCEAGERPTSLGCRMADVRGCSGDWGEEAGRTHGEDAGLRRGDAGSAPVCPSLSVARALRATGQGPELNGAQASGAPPSAGRKPDGFASAWGGWCRPGRWLGRWQGACVSPGAPAGEGVLLQAA